MIYLTLLFLPQIAYAIPLPQMATAAMSLGELLLIIFSILAIYFPFMKIIKKNNVIPYILLICSVFLNFYLLMPSTNKVKELREGMIWSEEDRKNDINSIKEEDAFNLMKENNLNYYFADVRTGAEKELGTANGFNQVNWKELAINKEKLKNKTVIVTCWTGMRGSEICSKLRAIGINCKYLQGGLKRWQELGYKINYKGDTTLFGSIPYYDNAEKFLTPEETKEHLKNKALMIDARSEKEFNHHHIKNAINIPFIDLTPEEINYKIQTLPVSKQGVIVSCFGLVSCSEASSFGWELNKLGFNYLGAYGGGQNLLLEKTNYFSLVSQIIDKFINLMVINSSLMFFVLIYSLLISLWLAIKKLTIESIKNKSKIKKNIYLFTSLSLTYIYYLFAYSVANNININNDKLSVLLAIISSIILSYDFIKEITIKKQVIFLMSVILSFCFLLLPNKVSFILCSTIILTSLLISLKNTIIKVNQKVLERMKFLSLKNAINVINDNGKAGKLSFLINKGYKIPDGYIINSKNIDKINKKDIDFIRKKLGEEIAIRSTAYDEDSINKSKAGINLSFVPVNTYLMKDKIQQVYLSYKSKKEEYVLLQEIIKPQIAGVVFSKNPELAGTMLIEYCEGFSDELMSGKKEAFKLIVNKKNKKILFNSNDKINIISKELIEICLKLEKEFNYSVDIEWAYDGKELWILQVRYQTALENLYNNSIEYDKDKLCNLEVLELEKDELSVILEGITRLNASIINELWTDVNVAELAAKMSYCKWNKKHKQSYYQYAFNYLWASNYPLIKSPNKFLNYISKKLFRINYEQMLSEKKEILKKFEIYKAIDFEKLDNLTLINMFKDILYEWKVLEKQALYMFFMTNNATMNLSNYLSELTINSFDKKEYSYYSTREYIIKEKRNLEEKETTKENLYLSENKVFAEKLSQSEKEKILFARKLLTLREIFKYDALKMFYIIRKVLLAIKNNLHLGEEFWELEVHEIEKIFDKNTKNNILKRVYKTTQQVPDSLNDDNIIYLNENNEYKNKKEFFVSNPRDFKGDIFYIKDVNSIQENMFENIKEKIIYVEYMTPELIMIAHKYKIENICSKYGSYLSHPSVLAREFNITCYIGRDLSHVKHTEIKQ